MLQKNPLLYAKDIRNWNLAMVWQVKFSMKYKPYIPNLWVITYHIMSINHPRAIIWP